MPFCKLTWLRKVHHSFVSCPYGEGYTNGHRPGNAGLDIAKGRTLFVASLTWTHPPGYNGVVLCIWQQPATPAFNVSKGKAAARPKSLGDLGAQQPANNADSIKLCTSKEKLHPKFSHS